MKPPIKGEGGQVTSIPACPRPNQDKENYEGWALNAIKATIFVTV